MTFTYDGRELEYFDHPYNATRTNERAVEIPIVIDFLRRQHQRGQGRGLEVGNVLHHYEPHHLPPWRVVDRYEEHAPAEALDVFQIHGQYDWIVSVSTLEHVRHGEPEQPNPWGSAAALMYLRGMLAPGGEMLVTVGLGQHPKFDEFLLTVPGRIICRRGRDGDDRALDEWEEAEAIRLGSTSLLPAYGPTHGANAVWIGEWVNA